MTDLSHSGFHHQGNEIRGCKALPESRVHTDTWCIVLQVVPVVLGHRSLLQLAYKIDFSASDDQIQLLPHILKFYDACCCCPCARLNSRLSSAKHIMLSEVVP